MGHPFSTIRLLAVDDNDDDLAVIRTRCDPRSFEVTTTNDPAEARRLHARSSYDVVLVDHHMPEVTGVELLTALRGSRGGVPIVIMTGHTEDSRIVIDAARNGASGFVRKELMYGDWEAFTESITSLVGGAPRGADERPPSDSQAGRDLLLMAALIRRSTVEAAARDARMTPEAAYGRIADPDFRHRLDAFDDGGANPVARLVDTALRRTD